MIFKHPSILASKSLSSAEIRCNIIKKDVLRKQHGLKKFLHYCFTLEVNIITEHKPLVATFKKM